MMSTATSGPSRWTVLWVIFVARTSMGYQFQSIGSVGPVLVEHLAIDFMMLGTLIGLYKFPGLFLAYPGGLLGQRYGMKSISVLGLFLMATGGLVSAYADTYFLISTGRIVAGVGRHRRQLVREQGSYPGFGDTRQQLAIRHCARTGNPGNVVGGHLSGCDDAPDSSVLCGRLVAANSR